MDWVPVLDGEQAERAIGVAREVAERLRDPDVVAEQARITRERLSAAIGRPMHHDPASAATGFTGLAVMAAQLDATFPGEGWDRTGHEFLVRASDDDGDGDAKRRMPLGLWTGAAGLAWAARALSRDGTRYRTMRRRLDNAVAVWSSSLVAEWSAALPGLPVDAYDLISGLTGTAVHLLGAREDGERAADAVVAVLEFLIAAGRERDGVPDWHTPRRLVPDGSDTGTAARVVNCGVAHGVPGALALMSIAQRDGVPVEGLPEAIDRAARWLVANGRDGPRGPDWEQWTPVGAGAGAGPPAGPTRAGWCYGAPGVARALWLAGCALDDDELRRVAETTIHAALARPVEDRQLSSPSVCHGIAGLLQISVRMHADTGDSRLGAAARELAGELMDRHDPASMFGYRTVERSVELDAPGLLAGVAGIPLALLAAAGDRQPVWDRLLLLS